ncbi:MAG: FtsW/RodA/SpoVE family cell cycle protein [Planctomycetota bacterium]
MLGFKRPDYGLVDWSLLIAALLLTSIGIAFIVSATTDFSLTDQWGREARMQIVWLTVALGACLFCLHIPTHRWRSWAWSLYLLAGFIQILMWAAAGSSLVPTRNGANNWIVVGPFSIQPSEFAKLAVLCALARFLTTAGVRADRFGHVLVGLGIAALPAAALAKEDLGSALTFIPMAFGLLLVAGMRLRHCAVFAGLLLLLVASGVFLLARFQPHSYQWQRIQAWMAPEDHALTTGFQTLRALRSIGSGQWIGKGYGEGDQNRLGWLPEKHTDMIFGVIGEEWGFLRTILVLLAIILFGYVGLLAALNCRDPFGRLFIAGFTSLIMGQSAINLAVVLGLMPVTGITLPFFSYGGSSLLATYAGIGVCLRATAVRMDQFSSQQLPSLRPI